MIISLITNRVHPTLRHLVSEDATLSELGWGMVDTWSLLEEIEQEQGRELDWTAGDRALTVAELLAVCRDNDGNPKGQDRHGLGRDAMTACPVGVAQNNPGEPVS